MDIVKFIKHGDWIGCLRNICIVFTISTCVAGIALSYARVIDFEIDIDREKHQKDWKDRQNKESFEKREKARKNESEDKLSNKDRLRAHEYEMDHSV